MGSPLSGPKMTLCSGPSQIELFLKHLKIKNILDFRLNMLDILSVLLCVRNRTMWHEIEPGMKTARKSFHCAFYCAKQKI